MLLYNAGLISAHDLEVIIETQKTKKYTIRFGEVAEEMGLVTPETIIFFVEKLPHILNTKNRLSLTECLQQANLLTTAQVELLSQCKMEKNIAKSIVEHKYLNNKTVQWFENLILLLD